MKHKNNLLSKKYIFFFCMVGGYKRLGGLGQYALSAALVLIHHSGEHYPTGWTMRSTYLR